MLVGTEEVRGSGGKKDWANAAAFSTLVEAVAGVPFDEVLGEGILALE